MKNTLLFLIMLLSGIADAQIVNIPDTAFKSSLLQSSAFYSIAKNSSGDNIAIDANGDGEIQVNEAQAVWELRLNFVWGTLQSMEGIEAFTNLHVLEVSNCELTGLDLTALLNLQMLNLHDLNYLQSLNVQNLGNLNFLSIKACSDLTFMNSLGLTALETLIMDASAVTDNNIAISGMPNLKYLTMTDVVHATIDFTQLPNLETVDLDVYNGVEVIDLSSCLNLKSLRIPYTTAIITFGSKPFLTDIQATTSSNLDLSGCTAITNLSLMNTMTDTGIPRFINLKNGITSYESFGFNVSANAGNQVYICIDEGSESLIPAYVLSNPYVQISTYCSFTPGGDYNTIAGNFTFDSDSNGCDGNDAYTGFVRVNMDNGIEELSTFTTSGHYNFYTHAGTYTLTPQLENDWFTITPATATITQLTIDNSTTPQNFCITANGVHPDIEVIVTPLWNAQPGFEAGYRVIYKNKGNQTLSGAVTFNYDDTVLDYLEASPTVTSSATGSLTWNYTNLIPFETRSVVVNMNLNGPMEIPAVNIDDVLAFSASATPTTGDETPSDNTFALNQTVTGSFDPNDIICLEGESASPDKIGEYLHYNINFENTGTAPATFIVVKDIIDETKFDINSIQLMDASHAIETRINGNKVEFIFDNINLGTEEKGNVTFKIKTKNTLQVNEDVTQQADIFFDYNWPIQTNEATTTFEVLSRGSFAMDNSVKVYPNPVKGIVTISADSSVKSLQLYDIQGRLLQSGTVNDIDTTIDLSSRNSGMYFLKVFTEKGIWVEKIVKQ